MSSAPRPPAPAPAAGAAAGAGATTTVAALTEAELDELQALLDRVPPPLDGVGCAVRRGSR